MKTLTQYKPSSNRALLLVGPPGSGKTTLSLHAPSPWIFDADNNMNGPAWFLERTNQNQFGHVKFDSGVMDESGKEIDPFNRWKHMYECIKVVAKDPSIRTLIFDGLTAIAQFAMDDIRRQNSIKLTDPIRIQDWGVFAHYMRTLVTSLRTLNKTCIFTAHQTTDKDEATGIYKTFLAISGQSRATFAGLFSDVWSTYVKESGVGDSKKIDRMVRTVPVSQHDERGLKESLALSTVLTQEQAIKIIQSF